MNKITVLKGDISIDDQINQLDPVEDKGAITALVWLKTYAVVNITDEEIENEVNQRNKGFSVGKSIHKSDFLACWEYIKQRING